MSSYALLPNSRGDADTIYYTANIINNNISTAGLGPDPIATYVDTRDTPILKDANDYECCVMKCKINGGGKTLPVLIPQIQVGSAINNTAYSVTLLAAVWDNTASVVKYATSDETFIQWIPENYDYGTQIPATATPSQSDSDYYYCYSYNHMVVLVNQALLSAYGTLQTNIRKMTNMSGYTLLNRCPTLEYDEVTKKFAFYTDTLGTAFNKSTQWANALEGPPTAEALGSGGINVLPTSTSTEFMMVGWNLNFDGLFTNFDTQYYAQQSYVWAASGGGTTSGAQVVYLPENIMIVRNKTGTNVQSMIDPTTGLAYATAKLNWVTVQDFQSTTSLWSPVDSIVLTTTMLPVRNEYVSGPITLGTGTTGAAQRGSASFQQVLLDFNHDYGREGAEDWRGCIFYETQGEFIPVSLGTSHTEIKSIDFKVNWRNRLTNTLVPLRLYNFSTIHVRLQFRRKK